MSSDVEILSPESSTSRLNAPAALVGGPDNQRYYLSQRINMIGRSECALITIRDPYVSRRHCSVEKKKDNTFVITDSSVYGTYVNNQKMVKNTPVVLKHKDTIAIPNGHVFRFFVNKNFSPSSDDSNSQESCMWMKIVDLENSHSEEMEKLSQEISQIKSRKTGLREEMNLALEDKENQLIAERNNMSQLIPLSEEEKVKIEKQMKEIEEKFRLEKDMYISEIEAKMSQILKKEEELKDLKNNMESKFQKEKQELEERYKAEIEELKDMITECKEERGRLEGENRDAEEKLKETKATLVEVELEQYRLVEEKMIVETELESKINDLTKESTTKDEVVRSLEKKIQEKEQQEEKCKKVLQGLEEELQCSICTEMLIEPLILNCGHIFCKVCINEWKLKNKICPMCRTKITSSVHIYTLDTIIEKSVALLPDEVKRHREQVIEERKKGPCRKHKTKRKQRAYHPYLGPLQARVIPPEPQMVEYVVDFTGAVASMQAQPALRGSNVERIENLIDISNEHPDAFAWQRSPRRDRMRERNRRGNEPDRDVLPLPHVPVAAIDLTSTPSTSGVIRTRQSTTTASAPDSTTGEASTSLIDLTNH